MKKIIFTALLFTSLIGCQKSNNTETKNNETIVPKSQKDSNEKIELNCNNEIIKQSANSVIQQKINTDLTMWIEEINTNVKNINISNIKTLQINNDLKNARCKGIYSFSYREKKYTIDFEYEISYLEDKKSFEVGVVTESILTSYIVARRAGMQ